LRRSKNANSLTDCAQRRFGVISLTITAKGLAMTVSLMRGQAGVKGRPWAVVG
jgi:hypothetical protein